MRLSSSSPSSSPTSSTMSSPDSSPTLSHQMPVKQRRRTGSFPSLAFSAAWDIPLKATPSPPSTSSSTTSSASDICLTPSESSPHSIPRMADSSYASLSHPDWPKSDTLSPVSSSSCLTSPKVNVSAISGSQASCYISDEDLLDLAQLPLYNDIRVPDQYAMYGYAGGLVARAEEPREAPPMQVLGSHAHVGTSSIKKPVMPGKKRRRSSPLKRKRLVLGMSPIPELGE